MKRAITLKQAQSAYPNRYTMEHRPQWALRRPCDSGGTSTKFYAPQFRSDAEWYENTTFPGEGELSRFSPNCETSGQTWPLGQWLDALIGTDWRTVCGHGRAHYRPDWSLSKPYVTYRDGTAGRHFATLQECADYFASLGMELNQKEGK